MLVVFNKLQITKFYHCIGYIKQLFLLRVCKNDNNRSAQNRTAVAITNRTNFQIQCRESFFEVEKQGFSLSRNIDTEKKRKKKISTNDFFLVFLRRFVRFSLTLFLNLPIRIKETKNVYFRGLSFSRKKMI